MSGVKRSYKVWVRMPGEASLCSNGCAFATRHQARAAGRELLSRWFAPIGFVVRASDEEVNYRFDFVERIAVSLR
jgi:hypothetical protein